MLKGQGVRFLTNGRVSPVSICIVTRFVRPISWLLNENTSGYCCFIFSNLSFVSCDISWSFSSTWWCSVIWAGENTKSESIMFFLCLGVQLQNPLDLMTSLTSKYNFYLLPMHMPWRCLCQGRCPCHIQDWLSCMGLHLATYHQGCCTAWVPCRDLGIYF